MNTRERIVTLIADKVAEKYMTGQNEIVAVGHNDKHVVVYSSKRKITKKTLPRKIDGVKIKVKKMGEINPLVDTSGLVA